MIVATIILLYALPGLAAGMLNYLVERGDPEDESPHGVIVLRSLGIGLIWLPYFCFAVAPRKDRVLLPKPPPHGRLPAA
ncbi:MAG: hypothetical protein FJ399_15720 [Verrucomicrobia bacterium]|nr:hypothetical protein [Verrucomicrobiota bacterium]